MTNGLYTSAAAMLPAMLQQDVIANNLANLQTTGFKKDDLFLRTLVEAGLLVDRAQNETVVEMYTDFDQGPLKPTGNPLDLALSGEGFFTVQTPEGIRYTRNGSFTLNPQGQLTTLEGYLVLGQNGTIDLARGEISITETGEVLQDGKLVDKLLITDFPKPYPLKKIGNGLFVPLNEAERGSRAEAPVVKQGFLEQANVNALEEMVNMLTHARIYELNQKAVKYQDETLTRTVNELGKVSL
ncbi:MAG: flagellar basal-body rod protein FlgF [candidate division KSB1 bacterium]|nr:flagellar basal-body rod protein FlgF [candidate division KSB1 bacterium]